MSSFSSCGTISRNFLARSSDPGTLESQWRRLMSLTTGLLLVGFGVVNWVWSPDFCFANVCLCSSPEYRLQYFTVTARAFDSAVQFNKLSHPLSGFILLPTLREELKFPPIPFPGIWGWGVWLEQRLSWSKLRTWLCREGLAKEWRELSLSGTLRKQLSLRFEYNKRICLREIKLN